MDPSLILSNLLNAPVLFFALGAVAVWVRSDLDIPGPISKFLSLYLLFSIGYKGGVELGEGGITIAILTALSACVLMASLTPIWSFAIVRRWVSVPDAAAIAATYGSISAVTFITAVSFLTQRDLEYGGYMVAAMAIMESPAIVVGIILARIASRDAATGKKASIDWSKLLHEAFLNGAVLLLLGSLIIGSLTHEDAESLAPFVKQPFNGVLCLFLLDMGLIAARRLGDLRSAGWRLVIFAMLAAVAHAVIGIALARLIGLGRGDALLMAVLCGSASYIAVPAAMRLSLPKANPGLFVPMSLGITFPFNVIIGIPVYMMIIDAWWT
ncbi:MAG: sodium-dependent bicarbonate transport family permease [Planctomycetota bacterium]